MQTKEDPNKLRCILVKDWRCISLWGRIWTKICRLIGYKPDQAKHEVLPYSCVAVKNQAQVLLAHLRQATDVLKSSIGHRSEPFIIRYIEPMDSFLVRFLSVDTSFLQREIDKVELLMLIRDEKKMYKKVIDRLLDHTRLALIEDQHMLATGSCEKRCACVTALFENTPKEYSDFTAWFIWREKIDQERQLYLS